MSAQIQKGPGNAPTTCERIGKAKLLALLPVGTTLTCIRNAKGRVNLKRTVLKATTSRIVMQQDEPTHDSRPTYLNFSTGDEFYRHDEGFSVVTKHGTCNPSMTLSYLFGHREPSDRPANTGAPA